MTRRPAALVPIHITEARFEGYKVPTFAGDARRFHVWRREEEAASEKGLFSGRGAVMPHVVERMPGRVRDVHVECECECELLEFR